MHNLEHGYTILWYDDTIADNATALDNVEAISRKFGDEQLPRQVHRGPVEVQRRGRRQVPRRPARRVHALVGGGNGETDTTKQVGAFQYCSGVSGAALEAFMDKYPYTDSPEPDAM